MAKQIKELLDRGVKVVLFCTDRNVAHEVHAELAQRLRPIPVYRHTPNSTSWRPFLDVADVSVLVCDKSAEEGVNLQGGRKAGAHFDLPLQPNRIEQRLGRVDRYGAGDP